MIVLLSCFGAGVVAALAVAALVSQVPRADLAAPRMQRDTVEAAVAAHRRLWRRVRAHADPAEVMGAFLAIALGLVVAALTAFGVLLVMVRTHTGLQHLDRRAGVWAADHATDASTHVLRGVTALGGTVGVIVVLVVIIATEYRRPRWRSVVAFLILSAAGASVIVNVSKVVIDRARPDIHRLTTVSSPSFPSGHSAQAAAVFAAVALVLGRGRSPRVRALLAGVAAGVAVSVAASRVLLGVHWFTDVLAGLAVGWGWFALTSIAFGGRWLHFAQPVEDAVQADTGARR